MSFFFAPKKRNLLCNAWELACVHQMMCQNNSADYRDGFRCIILEICKSIVGGVQKIDVLNGTFTCTVCCFRGGGGVMFLCPALSTDW